LLQPLRLNEPEGGVEAVYLRGVTEGNPAPASGLPASRNESGYIGGRDPGRRNLRLPSLGRRGSKGRPPCGYSATVALAVMGRRIVGVPTLKVCRVHRGASGRCCDPKLQWGTVRGLLCHTGRHAKGHSVTRRAAVHCEECPCCVSTDSECDWAMEQSVIPVSFHWVAALRLEDCLGPAHLSG
jgi:hypothetical protein